MLNTLILPPIFMHCLFMALSHMFFVVWQVKMAVSRKLCGAVIGQKGATIRDFMQVRQ